MQSWALTFSRMWWSQGGSEDRRDDQRPSTGSVLENLGQLGERGQGEAAIKGSDPAWSRGDLPSVPPNVGVKLVGWD